METDARYRHEFKYIISYSDYIFLRSRLGPIMQHDVHVNADGKYVIRSIYFDNYRDKALLEKINGIARREKFRIRYYNNDFSFITLEKKMKVNNLCMKLDAPISEEQCRELLNGNTEWMLKSDNELVKEFYVKIFYQTLRPRVLVSYTREPYVFSAGNVRVTFDSNIRSTLFHNDFLESEPKDIDISDSPGNLVLEVKYDDFLPGIISDILQFKGCRQEAFSKYGACRRFG